jgi:hypothetical protein
MTASRTGPDSAESSSLPDVRCVATLGVPSPRKGRCQLFIGHEPPHAVMYSRGDQRVVRTWLRRDVTSAEDDCAEIARLPWMFGYPVPAWIEEQAERLAASGTRVGRV